MLEIVCGQVLGRWMVLDRHGELETRQQRLDERVELRIGLPFVALLGAAIPSVLGFECGCLRELWR